MSYSKRGSYEAFLDAQQHKKQARWFRDVPSIMQGLTKVIQDLKFNLSEYPNYENKTLPELRKQYAIAMTKGEMDYSQFNKSQEAIANMISKINGWYRRTNIAVGIQVVMDNAHYGRAKIPERYELVVSDKFDISKEWE